VITFDLGLPENNLPWYCSCQRYETPELAYEAFVRLGETDPQGKLGVGVYRHQRIGLDKGAVLVSVVGLNRQNVKTAERILDGEETELHPDSWLELIKRRAAVVLDLGAQGMGAGRYRIVHEGDGMRLS
jgi:hypothetical protein